MKLDCFVILIFSATIAVLTLLSVCALPVEDNVLSHPSQNSIVTLSKKRDVVHEERPHKKTLPTSTQSTPLLIHLASSSPTPSSRTDNPKKSVAEDSRSDISQDEIDEKNLEEEAETIHRVIVVLGSLGASLFLVAIAIAILYWKVRKQQQLNKLNARLIRNGENALKFSKGLDPKNTGDENNEIANGINGTANASDMNDGREDDDVVPPITKSPLLPPKVYHEIEEGTSQFFSPKQLYITPHFSTRATAPPAEIFADDEIHVDNDDSDTGEFSYSVPPLFAPPAYTPTAPPIHSLPHIPIPDFGEISLRDVVLHDNHNTHPRAALIRMEILPLPTDSLTPLDTEMRHSPDPTSATEEQATPTSPISELDPSPDDTSTQHHHNSSSAI